MPNPYYFAYRALQVGFNINLRSHHINHAISKLIDRPNYPELGLEVRYITKIMRELSDFYAGSMNQNEFNYQTVFSARFDKQDENNQVLDETELFTNLNINHNLTETDIDKIDIISQLKQQIQIEETKKSGWRFDKNNSMTWCFNKTVEVNGRSYTEIPLRTTAILRIENDDKYCFIWSILATVHRCNNNHPNRVSNYRQYFDEIKTKRLDFTNGFKCSDVHIFNETNNSSVGIFEITFYRDPIKWKHKVITIEISKNESYRDIDSLIYKNHYVLLKKLKVVLGDHICTYVCIRCLNSYTSQNELIKQKQQCGEEDKFSLRLSTEFHLYWKKNFIQI